MEGAASTRNPGLGGLGVQTLNPSQAHSIKLKYLCLLNQLSLDYIKTLLQWFLPAPIATHTFLKNTKRGSRGENDL